jgi:hypothetical protein
VLLNRFNNVAFALKLEEFLRNHDMSVVDCNHNVAEIAFVLIKTSGVAEGTLVVGNGPLGSCHYTQIMVSVWVQGANKSVLGEGGSLD